MSSLAARPRIRGVARCRARGGDPPRRRSLSKAASGERLGVWCQSVSPWRKRFLDDGVAGVEEQRRPGRPKVSPRALAEIKALACELSAEKGVPLSRWSSAEIVALRRVALDGPRREVSPCQQ